MISAMSHSIVSSRARIVVAHLLAFALLLCSTQPQAADMTQTITLKPGWNAIHVALEPSEKDIASVFAGIPVRSVWRWIPGRNEAQFIRDPAEGLENVEGWFPWFPEPRPEALLTRLFTIDGNTSYLVRLDESSGSRQLTIRGTPRFVPTAWRPNDFTLTGLPVAASNAPSFTEFFSRSTAHQGQPVYRLGTDGRWQLASGSTPINANEAYWVFTSGNSRYQGRLSLMLDQGESLDFDRSFDEMRFVLRNLSGVNGSFQIERLGNAHVPLSLKLEDEETGEIGWPDLPDVEVFDAPAGEDVFVTLAIKRAQFTADRMEQMIAITDELGQRIVLHVGGNTAQRGAVDGVMRGKAGGDNPLLYAGLWIGNITIDRVSEAQRAGVTPQLVGSPFTQRVLIHVNPQGQARLVKDVIQMWEEGTMRPSSVNPAYQEVDQPGRYVLITNKNLIGLYTGMMGRDGVAVGVRYSTVAYDFADETLDFTGVFGPGGEISTAIMVQPELPTNPFLHRYHPDHNNLDEQFLNYQEEAYRVVRNMQFAFTDEDPQGGSAPGWGESVLGGTFAESITGLHRNSIFTSGTFRLRRASTVTVLNQ